MRDYKISFSSPKTAPLAAASAFVLWGLLPLYLRLMDKLPAYEILVHRIFWSFVFMLLISLATGRFKKVLAEIKTLKGNRKKLLCQVVAAFLICGNWLTFIWAINSGRVLETSLGYYIMPLLNISLGLIFLKERLSLRQSLAVFLAVAGVGIITVRFGSLPWVSIVLASTMAVYSFCKKVTGLPAIAGLLAETSITGPLALFFIFYLGNSSSANLPPLGPADISLLVGAGLVTVIPLMLFAGSLNKLPLSFVGIIQYISPTITFFLGIFYFHEPFSLIHLTAFIFIWLALALFTFSSRRL